MSLAPTPVFCHEDQLLFSPPYEWDKRGYVPHPESPERLVAIREALNASGDFAFIAPEAVPLSAIQQVHRSDLLRIYQLAEEQVLPEKFFYPTFFPKAHQRNSDPDNIHHAGFYCMDTSTPLGKDTLPSALASAASAYAAADYLLEGKGRLAYALTRPPGHHAHEEYFGGYCYFNNAAVAAARLREAGPVAVVDIDFHHGDGTQSIFYYDNQVLTVSLHADPRDHFPYFSGHAHEIGLGAGEGLNLNVPLPAGTDGDMFCQAITDIVLPKLAEFKPASIILALGLDTYRHDPICDFLLETEDYQRIGGLFAGMPCPVMVTQEGGYFMPDLGKNVLSFFSGLRQL